MVAEKIILCLKRELGNINLLLKLISLIHDTPDLLRELNLMHVNYKFIMKEE